MSRGRGHGLRGVALVDFITGSIILAGAVMTWATLTHAQIEGAAYADRRAVARNGALQALDELRLERAALGALAAAPDAAGFRLVRTFAVASLPAAVAGQPTGRLEARPLVVDGDATGGKGVFEVRSTVVWRGDHGPDRVEVSTALPGGGS